MAADTIDAKMLAKMFFAGARSLEAKKEWINGLNVFPVPDGDTGTNMTMTLNSAIKEIEALGDEPTIDGLCKAISSGSLRGARGNSGVILSQLLRGFTKGIKEYEVLTAPVFADAFDKAAETAYKAVMKPKEGTVLTVARGCADKAREMVNNGESDLEVLFGAVLEEARCVLSQTPDLLPVLKQAGVVDSGGQGLVEFLSGAYDAYLGKEVEYTAAQDSVPEGMEEAEEEQELKFLYCAEFVIMLGGKNFNIKQEMDFNTYLEAIGDSIRCESDGDQVKVRVHTNDPGLALQKALKYGSLCDIKIDNMKLEHHETLFGDECDDAEDKGQGKDEVPVTPQPDEPPKPVGFIAVSSGEGMKEIFESLGIDHIIEGGQTMNPSTADFLDAVDMVNAETIFILPNNKNVILSANQAAELMSEKNLLVIPTKTVPQGITAIINYVPEQSVDENEASMLDEIRNVKTGQVTYAVRDTLIDGRQICEGDYMGIGDDGLLSSGKELAGATMEMIDAMVDDESELISIYYGADVSNEDAHSLGDEVIKAYPDCDVEIQSGGQPIYYYIVSVE